MLSKINKNIKFMKIAFALAKERIGLTGQNPSVGCVITKNNKIISIGQTGYGGTPHAETNAINNSKVSVRNSTIYVSLEPCSHYGKTPPCTNKIIKSKINKVYYGLEDIDERSKNKARKILQKKKIYVKKNFLNSEAKKIYKSYIFLKNSDFPYVTGKIACSKNLITVTKNKYISNIYSLSFTHILRKINQGILISHITLNKDNPKLNCRLNGLDKFSPIRFILDKNLKIKLSSSVVKNANKYKTYVFYYKKKNYKINNLKKKGINLIKSPLDNNGKVDLNFILKKIRALKINYLLVEGGKTLTNIFLNKNLFNEFYLIKSKKNLKINASKISNTIKILSNNFKNKTNINTYLENDFITKYY